MGRERAVEPRPERAVAVAGLALAVLAGGGQAMAQTAVKEGAGAVQEVIVTARKREEALMRAPVIAQAIPAKQIENLHINEVQAITAVAPGTFINYGFAPTGITAYIRGVGNSGSATFADQSVALNIDGFTSSQGTLFRQGIFDASQIEVLKGPQSLFFGKSTSAGMIALHSADPTPDWRAEAKAGYEFEADELDVSGYVSGPLTGDLGLRLAAFRNTSEGYLENPNPGNSGHRLPKQTDQGVRLTLKYDNSDIGLRGKLKLSYSTSHMDNAQFEFIQGICASRPSYLPFDDCKLDRFTDGIPDGLPYSATADFRVGGKGFLTNTPSPLFKDGDSYSNTKAALGVLSLDYDITPGLTLSSVTGLDEIRAVDAGRNVVSIGYIFVASDPRFREFSEELRLTSNWKDRWYNFMIGGLYNPTTRRDELFIDTPGFTVWTDGTSRYRSETTGAFGQVLLTPIKYWELSAGVRYSHVRKTWESVVNYYNSTPVGSGVDLVPQLPDKLRTLAEDAWTPEVTLTYRPTDEVTAFVSYKKGYKGPATTGAGTIAPLTVTSFAQRALFVNGERAEGVEGGVKARLFDRQLALTATAYSYDYSNLQVAFYLPAINSATIQNGADAKVQGVEVGADYSPQAVPALTLNAFVNYNDAHYTRFTSAPCYQGQPSTQCHASAQDLSDRRLYFAPRWVGTLGAAYHWDLGEAYVASVDAQAEYTGAYFASPDLSPLSVQKAYWLINAALHLGRRENSWDLALICRNCTNEIYIANGLDGGGGVPPATVTYAEIGRTRQVMLQLTLHPQGF
jgi:outer membrane receptor protein involved in Fe transport